MPAEQRNPQPESWVVNWSEQQQCFHLETVEEMVLRNRDNFEHHSEVDFVPLCFAASNEDASEAAAEYRRMRNIPLLQDKILKSKR